MQKKLCSECGMSAEVSLCQSYLHRGPRVPGRQRCSTSTAFCAVLFYKTVSSSCVG